MNSVFTASNPFYHLQQNLDGTNIQRKAMGRTSGGLGCQEGGYIRGMKLYSIKKNLGEREGVRNRKVNSV